MLLSMSSSARLALAVAVALGVFVVVFFDRGPARSTPLRSFAVLGQATNAPQGIACSESDELFLSFTNRLIKSSLRSFLDDEELAPTTVQAEPLSLLDGDYNHLGAIAWLGDSLYAPLERSAGTGALATYNANDLAYGGQLVDTRQTHVPWLALGEGLLYSSEFNGVQHLFVYSTDNYATSHRVPLSRPLDAVQGGAFFNGTLYLSCEGRQLYSVNVTNGEVAPFHETAAATGLWHAELEGIAFCPHDGGTVLLILLSTVFPYFVALTALLATALTTLVLSAASFLSRHVLEALEAQGTHRWPRTEHGSWCLLWRSLSQLRTVCVASGDCEG